MSDTPRTDANAGWFVSGYGIIRSDGLFTDHDGPFVHANFARELERENAALRDALQSIRYRMPSDEFIEDHDAAAVSTFKQIKKIFKDARKEAQP